MISVYHLQSGGSCDGSRFTSIMFHATRSVHSVDSCLNIYSVEMLTILLSAVCTARPAAFVCPHSPHSSLPRDVCCSPEIFLLEGSSRFVSFLSVITKSLTKKEIQRFLSKIIASGQKCQLFLRPYSGLCQLLKSKNKCHFIIPILKVSVTKFQGFFNLSNFMYGLY